QAAGDRQRFMDPLRHAGGVVDVADLLEQDGELVSTHARHRVAEADAALQAPGDLDEELVAQRVAEAVVDDLEAVEVEEEDGEERVRVARGARQRGGETVD